MTDPPPEVQAAMREWQAVTDDLVAAARRVTARQLDAPSQCGDWTNRQLLIHLATGYGVRIAALRAVLDGAPAPAIDADAANAMNVARLAGAPLDEIIAELVQTRGRVLVLLSRLAATHLDAAAPLGGAALRSALASLDAHDLEHLAELRG